MNDIRQPGTSLRPPPIVFTGSLLDRSANLRRDIDWLAAQLADPESRVLPLSQLKALIALEPAPHLDWRPLAEVRPLMERGARPVLLGLEDGRARFALDASLLAEPAPNWGKFIDVRSIAPQLASGEAAVLAQARSLIDWHARHGFCAVCGAATVVQDAGYSRRCTAEGCGAQHFPRTDPVVIMLVLRGDHCLLGRQAMFPPGMFSALAGFIEPGETVEEAVRREVLEEVGVPVGAVGYHASQPWPFPSSLMIGCMAETAAEAFEVDHHELEAARWFSRAEVTRMLERSLTLEEPRMPPPLSLAHQLAKAWTTGAWRGF